MQDGLGAAACHKPVDPSGAGMDEGIAQGRRRSTFKGDWEGPSRPTERRSLHLSLRTILPAHSTAWQRATPGFTLRDIPGFALCDILGFTLHDIVIFPPGLTVKLKGPFTRQGAKGVGGVISKILITQVNKLGMLSQQAHAGCFTRDLTSQQREAQ